MKKNELSGLEYLISIKNNDIEGSSMSKTIPMKLVSVEFGKVVYEVKPDNRHLNLQGGIHGGFIATVIDGCTGAAVHSTINKGEKFVTIDLNVKMLKALKSGQNYKAVGEIVKKGSTICVTEAKIFNEDAEIFGYGSASILILN